VSRPLSGLTEKDRVTPSDSEELQHELFQFVDRYRERVGQATDAGVHRATTADGRIMFQATKTSYVSAAVSRDRPVDRRLLDLLVMVTCSGWSGVGRRRADPPCRGRTVAMALRRLERQIYDLAARVLPSDVIAKVRDLSTKWRRENPEQHYVAYVRFQNLGASSEADEVNEVISSGGVPCPGETVAREAHEAGLLAERTFYLVTGCPCFSNGRRRLPISALRPHPRLQVCWHFPASSRLERLGEEISRLRTGSRMSDWPWLGCYGSLAARERAQTMTISEHDSREREAFFLSLSKGADTYGPILEQLAVTAAATRDAVAALERMTTSARVWDDA